MPHEYYISVNFVSEISCLEFVLVLEYELQSPLPSCFICRLPPSPHKFKGKIYFMGPTISHDNSYQK